MAHNNRTFSTSDDSSHLTQLIKDFEQVELNTFENYDHSIRDMDLDIDPDINFFSNINNSCKYYTTEQFNHNINTDGKLSIVHINGRSLYANFKSIKNYLHSFSQPFNIIAISETWINDERGIDFEMDGYELTYSNRLSKGGGGVAIYVDTNFNFKSVEAMSQVVDNLLECTTIEICMENKRNVLISCVYRAPDSSIDKFREWMEDMFSSIGNKNIFVCGDINIDLLNYKNHKSTEDFINAIHSMSLLPTITRPSRITTHSATLIDNIFTNVLENKISGLLISDITDHLPVYTVFDCNYRNKIDKQKLYRRIRTDESINMLKNELVSQNWDMIYSEADVDSAYNTFLSIFRSLYDKHCPIKEYSKKQAYNKCPWLTKGLQNACKKKNALYRNFIRQRTKEAEDRYKTYKNKLTSIIRISKKEYYKNKLDNNKNNIKGMWNILNCIIRDGAKQNSLPKYFIKNDIEKHNMDEVADCFNRFFVNVGPDLGSRIPDRGAGGEHLGELVDRNPCSMFLNGVDENEILDIVKNCKNKKSTDFNDIDMSLVKLVIEGISKPLTHICNLSFKTGAFPNQMKIAKVIPLYKNGSKHHFTNYRPVSLLPQFSKILEKLFNSRLDSFLERFNVLSECQYGFRTNRSTSQALMESIERIIDAIDNQQHAIGIFIDLKKAFDTINHNILLYKLEKIGIRGTPLDWIKSYLDRRQQFVKLGNHSSTCLDIVCGVPQGSVLGPKLFILYINDICQVSKLLSMVLFADDTNVFCSGDNIYKLQEDINEELNKLKLWFDWNKLSLNVSKTKFMLFGKFRLNTQVQIVIDGVAIERVHENKFLGVTVDDRLSWKPHITHVKYKVARSIAVINKAKQVLDYKSLHTLYCSLVLPYFHYCAEVWGNNYKSSLQSLIILQKRAIRTIHKVGYQEHTNPLFLQSKLLKFTDIVSYQTAIIMYKAKNHQLPANLQNLFHNREGGYNLRSELNFKILKRNSTMKGFCISIAGVKLWNSLSEEQKQCPSINQFKARYRSMMFTRYSET